MNKPSPVRLTLVDRFNHELDRVIHGGFLRGQNFPPEDTRALELAKKLSALDLSDDSNIRASLRKRFSENSIRPEKRTRLRHSLYFHEGRLMTGFGATLLIAITLIIGLVIPHDAPTSAAYNSLAASAIMSELPAASLTMTAARPQNIYPHPIPTPLAISAYPGLTTTSPERTPALMDPASGSEAPLLTTTTSK